jgi:hypothetical protein
LDGRTDSAQSAPSVAAHCPSPEPRSAPRWPCA